jgi:cyanophycinase
MRARSLLIGLLLVCASTASAQTPRIDPAGIEGSLLLCGSYAMAPEMCDKFVQMAGGAKAKIVILTFEKAPWGEPPREPLTVATHKANAAEPIVIDYADARKAFPEATGLWIHVDSSSPMPRLLQNSFLADQCKTILKRGGAIASAAAGIRYFGSKELVINGSPCMKLLPDALLEIRAKDRNSRMGKTQNGWKGLVAYEIDYDAAMLVTGRSISAVGPGAVHAFLPRVRDGIRDIVIQGKSREDLTVLRRALVDRMNGFPPKQPEPPFVENGTLVIVGGGGQPNGLTKKFVDYAGGQGKANIVIFATASEKNPLPKREVLAEAYRKAGAKKATVLYAQKQAEVESKEFLDTLKEATGLWFDGGRQWRFVDCYENTKALPLMFDVLKRGGVIGGSSAGATIQGDYLARGGVFNNFDIRYEGYERGLGFLKGVAIDQHFTQRERQADMTKLMKVYPQYLGIGIDEATAIVVKKSTADVIGKGKVHFYDARRKLEPGEPDYEALSAGGRYDLKERKIISSGN